MKVRLLMLLVVLLLPTFALADGLGKKQSVVKKDPVFKDIKFSYKGATVRPEYYSTLDQIYSALKQDPHLRVSIQGYTDNEGSNAENMKLSKIRAMNVEEYLIQHGLPTHRVEIGWHGNNMPVASRSTEVGSAQNRRVTVTLIRRDAITELPKDLGLTE